MTLKFWLWVNEFTAVLYGHREIQLGAGAEVKGKTELRIRRLMLDRVCMGLPDRNVSGELRSKDTSLMTSVFLMLSMTFLQFNFPFSRVVLKAEQCEENIASLSRPRRPRSL